MSKKPVTAYLFISAIGIASISFNAQSETVAEAIMKCKQEQNSLKRLVCFDEIANNISDLEDQSFEQAQEATPAQALVSTVRNPGAQKQDDFGKTQVDETPDELTSRVTEIKEDRLRGRTITLQNGQVWREVGYSGNAMKEGQNITIEKGVFGSFYLKVEGSNRQMQVRRVR